MIFRSFITALAFAVPCAASAGTGTSSIDQLTWKQRVLIVFADAGSPQFDRQRALLAKERADMSERDLVMVEVAGASVKGVSDGAEALRHRYGVAPDAFRVLLIGKDGGVKIDSSEPVRAAQLFSTIDAMPMRRQEASNKSN